MIDRLIEICKLVFLPGFDGAWHYDVPIKILTLGQFHRKVFFVKQFSFHLGHVYILYFYGEFSIEFDVLFYYKSISQV